jgi:predicted phosphodiesterase
VNLHPLLTTTPGRLAFCGDWHGNLQWAAGRVQSAATHDVGAIVHAGDFGVWGDAAGVRFLDALSKLCVRNRIPLFITDGNHEDFDFLYSFPVERGLRRLRPYVFHLPRGTRWVWGGVRFGALGGATSVDKKMRTPGVDWWPQEALTAEDVAAFLAGGEVDVAVCHDRPSGVDTPGVGRDAGLNLWGHEAMNAAQAHSELLASALVPCRPRLLVHGHTHVRYTSEWRYAGGVARVEGLGCDGQPGNVWTTTIDEILALVHE